MSADNQTAAWEKYRAGHGVTACAVLEAPFRAGWDSAIDAAARIAMRLAREHSADGITGEAIADAIRSTEGASQDRK